MSPLRDAAPRAVAGATGGWQGLRHFFQHDLWEGDLASLAPLPRMGTRGLRFLTVAAWDVRRTGLPLRATGLVYATLLSLVPFLAVTISVLKAFGVHQQLAPVLNRAFEPMGDGAGRISGQIIGFVDNMKVGVLGIAGVAGLFLTVISLLGRIEDAFNHIWRVRRARSLGRRFTDYLSVVLVGPVLVLAALGLTASAQSSWIVRRVLDVGPIGAYLVPLAGRVLPVVLLCVAFTVLYRFMPHTRVRFASALAGGAIAAVLWELAGMAFTAFVAKSPSYAAVYSGLAIVVLFLIWLDYAWLIVLVGAEVAYLHQHPATYLTRVLRRSGHHGFRERLALRTLVAVTRRHLAGERPWRIVDLAAELHAPPSSVEELADELVHRGILLHTASPAGLTLGRPPEQVSVAEVIETVRGPAVPTVEADPAVPDVLARRDRAVRAALDGVTLRALALGEAGSGETDPRA